MSQSILQNGYAILLSNTSDLDNRLLEKTSLLQRLTRIKERKTVERDTLASSYIDMIKKVDTHISNLLMSGSDADTISAYASQKIKLEQRLAQVRMQNVNATYDDVRKTHAFFINATFKPLVSVAYGYSVMGTTPLPMFGSSVKLKIQDIGDFILDQAIHIRLSALEAVHLENKARWFDFIGHRLIKEVRLVCDGAVIDRYGTDEMEMYYRFHLSKNQKMGWMRCIGQETPKPGVFLQDPVNQEVRERKMIYDGLQTQKKRHEAYDLYIPLLFWYNTNPSFALSNWNITFDKLYIEVDFEEVAKCVQVIDYANDGGKYIKPTIEACDLVSNHVFTTPEVADLFKHQMQFSIVRVHKRIERLLDKAYDSVNISDIKFAVENLYIRFRPLENERDGNAAEIWRRNNVSTYKEVKYASIVQDGASVAVATTAVYYYDSTPVANTLSLVSKGNTIYDINPGIFYNSYIPLRFGADTIITPDEDDAYLMTFSIYPNDAQPSGYLNFSQSNEQYLTYDSSYIDVDHPVSMVVCSTCINFLILMHGSISLRYAT